MAALIGDLGCTNCSPSRPRLPSSTLAFQNPQPQQPSQQRPCIHYSTSSTSANLSSTTSAADAAHHPPPAPTAPVAPPSPSPSSNSVVKESATTFVASAQPAIGIGSAASRIPTPPDSSSPTSAKTPVSRSPTGDGSTAHMASNEPDTAHAASDPPATSAEPTPSAARPPPPTNAIPSPASDNYHSWTPSRPDYVPTLPASSSPLPNTQRMQRTIHIRDLSHIENLAQLDVSTGNGPGILNDPPLQDMKFEISSMPIGDIISMVAALLTKITTTNDHQHDALNRNATQQRQVQAQNDGADIHTSPFSASVLAFHGKNVPAITIMSYLSRIHKYCPTTYEVFLSLLVYFDRMTERVNDLVIRDEELRRTRTSQQQNRRPQEGPGGRHVSGSANTQATSPYGSDTQMRDHGDGSSQGDETDEGLADSDDGDTHASANANVGTARHRATPSLNPAPPSATYFVVDSFNIHRLIIAGVTCASKFFSDVFYTNSRYAKVGGLPLAELNHLELQFLILNDFRLAIPLEDLEAYATMLVEFYAREVVGKRTRPSGTVS